MNEADLRRQLAALSDPLALLLGIFAHAPFGLQVYEANGRSLLVNDTFERMFGTVPPPDYNVLRDEIAERNGVLGLIHRAFSGEVVQVPTVWYDPRELKQVQVAEARGAAIATTFFPLRSADGAVSHVAVVFRDLTNELLAREQAESERDLLRAVIEQSGEGIIVCDAEGVLHGMNREAERQHGVGGRAVPAGEWAQAFGLFSMNGDPLPLEETPLYQALHGQRVENARWKVRRPDGAYRTLTGTATPLQLADGMSAGAVVTSRDETERLALQEQLLQESADKDRLYKEAQELNRVKDEFLATVSHELRTPLQAILGWARLLKDMPPGDEVRLARGLETIDRNARAQVQLIEDILDASRMVTGQMRLEWQPVDLVGVLQAALDGARPTAEAKRISIVAALAAQPIVVSGDPERLQQIVWNLLSNALKFTPGEGSVRVVLRAEREHAIVEVEDTGQGISAAFLPHVFDRFRQADSSTTRAQGGLGLGLAIARHLAELHGGSMTAASEGPGRGARFALRLPLAGTAPPAKDPAARAESDLPELAGVRVLLVDDEEDTREILATVLREKGALVTGAASTAEALAVVATVPLDILVSDIGMPGADGYELILHLRALPPDKGGKLPAVALTAYAGPEDRRRVIAAGFQVHMAKPIDPNDLVRTLFGLLERQS